MRAVRIAFIVLFCGVIFVTGTAAADREVKAMYEAAAWSTQANGVDKVVERTLAAYGLDPRPSASDTVFFRRVWLDLLGTMPSRAETGAFLADRNPTKRAALVEKLLARDEFADYQSLKWGDILRIKSEFPSNLWPNAVQAYNRWIREAVKTGMPYDDFVRALLTGSGSNSRVPQVNFFRAVSARDPASLASAVCLAFMGMRYEKLSEGAKAGMAGFFSRVAYKRTLEWKEEIVYTDPRPLEQNRLELPDGSTAKIPAGADPREVFADWLTTEGNSWLARAFVNRVWFRLMGRGIVEPVDDISPGNPSDSPELLDYLSSEFIKSGWDVRALYALIINSRTYQQSSLVDAKLAAEYEAAPYARYEIRRLDAEVIIDALCRIGGKGENYVSPIPEPFTFIPPEQRTIALADGSITSAFLVKFGRPSRDTGLESERDNRPTAEQILYMLNSTDVKKRLDTSPILAGAYALAVQKREEQIRAIYLELLSRPPMASEMEKAQAYFKTPGLGARQAATDLAWALVNGKEFLYRH